MSPKPVALDSYSPTYDLHVIPPSVTFSTRLKWALMGVLSETTYFSLQHYVETHPAKSD